MPYQDRVMPLQPAHHLQALCFILNQFLTPASDHASLDPINNLNSVTYADLKAFESSWTQYTFKIQFNL